MSATELMRLQGFSTNDYPLITKLQKSRCKVLQYLAGNTTPTTVQQAIILCVLCSASSVNFAGNVVGSSNYGVGALSADVAGSSNDGVGASSANVVRCSNDANAVGSKDVAVPASCEVSGVSPPWFYPPGF